MYRVVRMGEEVPLGMALPAVEIFTVQGRGRALGDMARHRATPQLLVAVDGRRWGMWLAPPGEAPVGPVWIEVAPEEALLLEPGTWHRGPVPLESDAGRYLTIEAPGTNQDDFDTHAVATSPAVFEPTG